MNDPKYAVVDLSRLMKKTEVFKCPFNNGCCLCHTCKCNSMYDECTNGYCIYCYECKDLNKAVHDIDFCAGFNPVEK